MAHLKKLAIRGVRSFSPDDEQTMEFQTPLTMIVGHNGCGKTTIIECLKYACTGVLPPGCSRGQAFVHDPKYSGTTEVKASIKLRFANSMAEPMVVVRAMSLTQSKTRMTFKALDGTIRTHGADGSNKSASHKCIDLDKNIPGYLGVPRSILENVIFCHQEESSWPLQEGAVVKKKFDDIFESTRYTKALDAIKKSSKECNEKSKELKIELAELNANMGAAVQFMEELESQKAKKSKYEARAKEDADSLAEIESSLAALEKQSEQVLSVRLQRKQVQSSLSNLSVQIQENERHLPKLLDSESDENLQEYLDDFDSLLATIKQEYEKQAGLEGEVKQSLEAAKEQRNRLHQSRGALEAMMEDEDRKRNAQRATADRLALEYDLVAAQLDPPGIASALAEKVKKLRTLLVTTREAAHKREGELQREASTLQAQYESGKGVRTSRAKEVAEVEARVRQARMDVQRLQQRAVGLPSLEEASQKAAAAREALDKFTSDMTTKELKDKITAAQKEIAGLDVDIRNDDYAISAARESAGEQRDLATALTTIEQDKAKLATDVTTVAVDGLDALLDFPLPHGEDAVNLETLITAVEQLKFKEARCDEEVKKARESAGRASNEAALKEGEVKRLTLAAQKAQADLQKLVDSGVEQNVVDSVAAIEAMRKKNEEEYNQGFATRPPPPFGRSALSDGIKFIRDLRAVKDKELSEYAGRAAFYTSIKENVEAKMMAHEHLGKCHLCRRELDADAARKTLQVAEKNANDERAVEIREVRDQAQACLQKAELLVDPWTALLKLRPEVDEKKRAVATAEEEAKAAQDAERTAVQAAEKAEAHEAAIANGRSRIQAFVTEAQRIARNARDADEKRRRLAAADPSSEGRTLGEIEARYRQKQDQREKLRDDIARWAEEVQGRGVRQVSLLTLKNERENEEAAAKDAHSKLDVAKEGLESAQARAEALKKEIDQLEASELPLRQQSESRSSELESVRRANREEEQRLDRELRKLEGDAGRMHSDNTAFEDIKKRDVTGQFSKLAEDLDKATEEVDLLQKRLTDIHAVSAEAQASREDQLRNRSIVHENISLRKLKKHEVELKKQLENFRSQEREVLGGEDVDSKIAELRDEMQKIKENRAGRLGSLHTVVEHVKELEAKLASSTYRNIQERHRHKVIELQTTLMAVKDLERYWTALDKALIRFHEMRIKEINRIIQDLWASTYQGGDIDMIRISSGEEGASNKAKRSYNYRVDMMKGNTPLEMRGRCSAGQRVLASIIVRLALAESFCLNCGVLALDEPTTNLDYDNKVALAGALSKIISGRLNQSNFQLICITHDDDFVQHMKQSLAMQAQAAMPEKFWRVEREKDDHGRFYSKIKGVPFG